MRKLDQRSQERTRNLKKEARDEMVKEFGQEYEYWEDINDVKMIVKSFMYCTYYCTSNMPQYLSIVNQQKTWYDIIDLSIFPIKDLQSLLFQFLWVFLLAHLTILDKDA